VPGETRTLPIAIYAAMQMPDGDMMVTRFAILSTMLSLGALMLSEIMVRRIAHGGRHVV